MKGAETRLKLLVEIVDRQVRMKLRGHCFFKNFGQIREIGDGTEIIEVIGVGTGFLEYWSDSSRFKR